MKRQTSAADRQAREDLKKLREIMNMTQRELAGEFYVTSGAIAHWEAGNRPVPGPVRRLIELYQTIVTSKKASDAGN